jgi:signal transduction histidine kinase
VSDLSLLEEFNLSSNVEEDYFSRELLRSSIERISVLNKTKLNYEISKNIPDKFLTEQNCLYGVLFNLIKNAVEHGKENDINVNVDFQDSYPDKIIFQPKGSENYNKFVGFHISNKGEGFSKNKNLQEYFTKCPGIKERGFGLYFTGLVAKLLQAPVNIESQRGETKVSFFQPIYESCL